MPTYEDEAGFDPLAARSLTEAAIREGEAGVIYQAYLSGGAWRGFADFLERLPDRTYEPVDTKLARSAKPAHLLQLCFYATQLERIQGKLPEHVHVELGTGGRETFRTAEYIAYFRQSREKLLDAIANGADTWPWPCEHCGICDFRRLCHGQRVADDSLILVAGMGRRRARCSAHGTDADRTRGDSARALGTAGIRLRRSK
jgi:uncharacterized protein